MLRFLHARASEKQSPNPSCSPQGGLVSVCLSPSSVRKEGWSVFSGRTPFGWGSAPLYWPLCGSLIELSCQQAARSQCTVHYVIQTHSGAPREVLGSADNDAAPSSNTQSSVASLSLSAHAWISKTLVLTISVIPLFKTGNWQCPLNFSNFSVFLVWFTSQILNLLFFYIFFYFLQIQTHLDRKSSLLNT